MLYYENVAGLPIPRPGSAGRGRIFFKGDTAEDVVQNCIREVKEAGLVKEMEYDISGMGVKLELRMKGNCLK